MGLGHIDDPCAVGGMIEPECEPFLFEGPCEGQKTFQLAPGMGLVCAVGLGEMGVAALQVNP